MQGFKKFYKRLSHTNPLGTSFLLSGENLFPFLTEEEILNLNLSQNEVEEVPLYMIQTFLREICNTEIMILPVWKKNDDKTLSKKGYTYSIIQCKEGKYDAQTANIATPIIDDGKCAAPIFVNANIALNNAICYIKNHFNLSNEGNTYSLDISKSFHCKKIPHYTPYALLSKGDGNYLKMYRFIEVDEKGQAKMVNVNNEKEFITVTLLNETFRVCRPHSLDDDIMMDEYVTFIQSEEEAQILLDYFTHYDK